MNNVSRSQQPDATSRLAVDLDQLEQQLRQLSGKPQAAASREDPLAELARLVGREDPIRSLLSRDDAGNSGHPQGYAQGHPQDYSHGHAPDVQPRRLDHSGYDAAAAAPDGYHAPQARPAEWAADDYDTYRDPTEYPEPEIDPAQDFVTLQRHRSRKGMYTVAAIIGASVVGIAGALALRGGGPGVPSGEVPVITAQSGPSKVQPQNPGGVEIPNQNKQIYEKPGQGVAAVTKVVNREEQPMDVVQAARAAASRDSIDGLLRGQGATPGAAAPAPVNVGSASPLGEPKKVRTVTVRPDGTILPEGSEAKAAPAQQLALAPTSSITTGSSTSNARTAEAKPQAKPGSAQGVSQAPARADDTVGAPLSISPSPQPKLQQRVASIQPVAIPAAPAEPKAQAAAAPGAGGDFMVQLAARPSERDALDAFATLQKKYADLSGLRPIVRKAEVGDKTIYRLRVGALSREEANGLCQRLQASGGQCFVARN